MLGRTISHYRIVGQLGSGGMGIVYAAEDIRLGRSVALKFVSEDLAKDRQTLDRLRREARAASALSHANICTIYDIDDDDERPFIVMELLKGQTLSDFLTKGTLPIRQVVDVAIQVADALDAVHAQGILHRDIKPANLFLTDRGQVKILDFGLAKQLAQQTDSATTAGTPIDDLTTVGVAIGTVCYMSPEQVTGEPLDGRTDLFSLGIVLYECVTGRRPFTGKTSAVIFSAILNHTPQAPSLLNPKIPSRLEDVITSCLEKDRELRYQDAAGLRADLKRVKRDLEAGNSGAVRTVSRAEAAEGGAVSQPGALPHSPEDARPRTATSLMSGRSHAVGWASAVAGTIIVAVIAAGSWMWWRGISNSGPALPGASNEVRPSMPPGQPTTPVGTTPSLGAGAPQLTSPGPPLPGSEPAASSLPSAPAASSSPATASTSRRPTPSPPPAPGANGRPIAKAELTPPPTASAASSPASPAPSAATQSASTATQPTPATPPAPTGAATQSPAIAQPPATTPPPAANSPATTAPTAGNPPPAATPAAPSSAAASPAATPQSPAAEPTRSAEAPRARPDAAKPAGRDGAPDETVDDDAAIRQVIATYARAIETKSVALFKAVKPNLSSEEQRRLEDSFRAVSSQRVNITILSIARKGREASVQIRRRDDIEAGGRRQTADSQQTVTLDRIGNTWVIREIGR